MPDSEGYLTDNEVLIDGEVWKVREQTDPDWLCEEWVDDETECPEAATVELHFYEEDCDGSYHTTKALCEKHFEELKKEKT